MIEKNLLDLKRQFHNSIRLKEKRPNLFQLFGPFYHPDGDMMEIFLREISPEKVLISDEGLTLMRLSYDFEIDTTSKKKTFDSILEESGVSLNAKGAMQMETHVYNLTPAILQFVSAITKVTNMRLYKRESNHSHFLLMLDEFVMNGLQNYKPQKKFLPIKGHDEFEVDYSINHRHKPLYIFGVHNDEKAKLTTINCLTFMRFNINFMSLIILEDVDIITRKDKRRLMSAADKQFPDLDDFILHAEGFIERNN